MIIIYRYNKIVLDSDDIAITRVAFLDVEGPDPDGHSYVGFFLSLIL